MEQRIAELEARLAAVERRLSRLEGSTAEAAGGAAADLEPHIDTGFLSNAPTLIGRVLLIFGGAYLLRAITEAELVPTGLGLSIGAAYALFWLYMAYRQAGLDRQQASALFYGGSSLLLALPLLVESASRFALLSGPQAIVALALFCSVALVVAFARDLHLLGWATTAGAIITGFVILKITHSAFYGAALLVFIGLASLWACYLRNWTGIRWLGALGADAGIAVLALLSISDQWTVSSLSAFSLGALLLASYLASFALHTHIRDNAVHIFETVQAFLAIAVTFLTASLASRAEVISMEFVGALSIALAAGAYLLAFTPETRAQRGRNFFFYSTLGLLLLVIGSALLLSPPIAAAAWSLLALAMAWFSGRYQRVALSLQCTFLLVAAGASSGILATGLHAFVGDAAQAWPALVPWHVVIALTTVACLFIPVAQHSERWGTLAGLPQLIVLALSIWEVGGLMVLYLAPALAQAGTPAADSASLAALRTAVLAASSVTLALSSRHRRWPEARWLVYPVLLLVGLKLFAEDFPNGEPVSLFVALALVGSALIVVARLLKKEASG